MDYPQALERLRSLANPEGAAGAARYGIAPTVTLYGIPVPALRKLAKDIGKDQTLAEQLWVSGIHEGRLLATMIAKPALITPRQMEQWAADFDSWDVCDQCCNNLFQKTPFAYEKAVAWSARPEEFVKRAGFTLMACLAVHDKKAADSQLTQFLPIIQREAGDERNFVRKAVNWALRQIGKRSRSLNSLAIETARTLQNSQSKSARWIANDALRELTGEAVQKRLAG